LERRRRRWLIPFGSAVALIVGNGPVSVFAFGVFMKPLEAEFGWSRASVSTATALCGITSAVSLPLIGLVIDRFGIRRPVLVAIGLFAANVGSAALPHSLLGFQLLIALTGITGAGQSPIGYVKAISRYFDARRGVAIGIAMSGVGLGTALLPLYAQWIITQYGWRSAYAGLGAAIVLLAMPVALTLLPKGDEAGNECGVPRRRTNHPDTDGSGAASRPFLEAVTSRPFWLLAIAVMLASVALNGCLVHIVPALIESGWHPASAAAVMLPAGLAGVFGRILAGFLIDKLFAPYVALVFFLLAAAGTCLLSGGSQVIPGVVAVGLAAGAEVDLIGFLVSRYFGLSSFGRIYGLVFSVFTVGAGLGPFFVGVAFSARHSYDAAFLGIGALLALATLPLLLIGPYTHFDDAALQSPGSR
jgi:predicted MFS family arabinose efflux permease